MCFRQNWLVKHMVINRKRVIFTGNAIKLFGNYLLWWLLSVITLGIYGIWLPMKVYGFQVKNTHIKLKDEVIKQKSNTIPVVIAIIGGIIFLTLAGIFVPVVIKAIKDEKARQDDIYRKNNYLYPENFDDNGVYHVNQ